MTALALHHVQVAIPPGGEDDARRFYGTVLGLPEVPKPAELAGRGGVWFERGRVRLHVGVDASFTAARKAHPALQFDDLDAVRRRCRSAGVEPVDDRPLAGFDRTYVPDPFGNRIELIQVADGETASIGATAEAGPVTAATIAGGLRTLGIGEGPGDTPLLADVRLSAFGWICGDVEALVSGLLEAAGPRGTVMMPAHSGDRSDPANWSNPPVPPAWWPVIRDHMPVFDPATTPTRALGRTAEAFCAWPDVHRSGHPMVSFTARGPAAADLLRDHPLEDGLGPASPLGRLRDAGGSVLMLGNDWDSCTMLHLAEREGLGDRQPRVRTGSAMRIDGRRTWVPYDEFHGPDDDDFPACGAAFERAHGDVIRRTTIGLAPVRLIPARSLVAFAAAWFAANRP